MSWKKRLDGVPWAWCIAASKSRLDEKLPLKYSREHWPEMLPTWHVLAERRRLLQGSIIPVLYKSLMPDSKMGSSTSSWNTSRGQRLLACCILTVQFPNI